MRRRRGLATLDYVLVLGVILPLAAFLFRVGPKIIRLAYEMVCVISVLAIYVECLQVRLGRAGIWPIPGSLRLAEERRVHEKQFPVETSEEDSREMKTARSVWRRS